jgi:hypothetical protein
MIQQFLLQQPVQMNGSADKLCVKRVDLEYDTTKGQIITDNFVILDIRKVSKTNTEKKKINCA